MSSSAGSVASMFCWSSSSVLVPSVNHIECKQFDVLKRLKKYGNLKIVRENYAYYNIKINIHVMCAHKNVRRFFFYFLVYGSSDPKFCILEKKNIFLTFFSFSDVKKLPDLKFFF